ncbi:acylglycerol kinase family protein [Mycobacterium intracellulare subsp. chimaera]|uniref:diacylglycerol/lipid kinase family protein n=1 Tax=Mycobacterium intracellulare TaxID=1767 RepID=UPI00044671B5|nr:diacylglycerol kinase family protein [Mycobacterium intracellulare]AOS93350.1 retinol dehydrogenase [Mycobacterium intracellulare subsp. chimaera]ARV83756.1 retinol dehydrogenase [Mycobacterium intracellulare subsp. chimaera]ASL11003.1 Diacylglycerol kinase catalytic domain protein [Mycobacterium intracellulare subsp. chimaera]ASL22945.1 Diacylglycerol kinase catalytic domain protein [Mycobacterium intracellulare subsp. chimaera]ETZ29124.1 diacylglycerol kinase catalytic domain protein [Myc
MFLGVIVNPKARKNRAAPRERIDELRRLVGPWGEVHETASIDDLRETIAQIGPRVTHLVGDGGDGALHWLINETERCIGDPESWPAFVPSNGGSVNAVARKARVRGRPETIIRALVAAAEADQPPPEMWLDTLVLDGETDDGTAFHRLCFGLAAGGVGNRFYDRYYDAPDHGRLAVARVIARSFGDYITSKIAPSRVKTPNYASILFTPTSARVVIDGEEVPSRTHSLLHAGAIDLRIGGPLRLFPKASEPGALHFQAGYLRPSRIVAQLPTALTNGMLRGKGLRDVNGHEMIIEAEDEPLSPIIDGERFLGIVKLVARAGPRIRIAQVAPSTIARAHSAPAP